jgi:hypothetical protein
MASNTAPAGMFKPTPHIRGAATVSSVNLKKQTINWKFNDDQREYLAW